MPIYLAPYRAALYQALAADNGVIVTTNDPRNAMNRLYKARNADPVLKDGVSLTQATMNPDYIYILRRHCYAKGNGK